MSNRDRHHCMISTCSWYYERDSGPTSAELERALMFGPEDAGRDRAMRTNAILRDHFEMTHTLEEWVVEIGKERQRADKAEKQLAEMTRCRDNAMAYANREHVPIGIDDEIDIDGEVLADRIEGELLGPGWDWEDDRTPGQLAQTAVAVIRPHLARLTDQAQQARAQLAEIGETRERIVLTLKCMSTKHDQDAETYADERSPLLTAQAEAFWDAAQMVTNGEWMQWGPKQ